jgi:hypothetical protein
MSAANREARTHYAHQDRPAWHWFNLRDENMQHARYFKDKGLPNDTDRAIRIAWRAHYLGLDIKRSGGIDF